MDLKLFFEPIDIDVDQSPDSFQSSIYINHEKMPDQSSMDVALIGLNEYRGAGIVKSLTSCDDVRKQLYALKKGNGDYGIIDLGNFRNGPTLEETYFRLREVCSYLLDKGVLPILFGGSHDLDIGQFQAYESMNKRISVLGIDNRIDLASGGDGHVSHLSKIIQHNPNFLFNYYHLGYQSFLVSQKDLELLEQMSFEAYRLGWVREKIKEVEPIIRDSDMLSFDLGALKSDYSITSASTPYGLTGEEACQICWYAGQNEKMTSFGLYNMDLVPDSPVESSFIISTMIWYLIEGIYHRKDDSFFKSNDYLLYEVHLGGEPETIRFYKSRLSDRWWMEIPNPHGSGLFDRSRLISCNYIDYATAMNGKVPDRWYQYYLRS
jgi:formiminoglutamase